MPCSSVPPGRGWAPLRGSVLSGSRTLPLSGVLLPDDQPRLAVVLPVTLDDGARALVVGLWDPRRSALQQYVSELGYGRTGHGYVVDGVGRVIAGPTPAVIGDPLPMVDLRSSIRPGSAGILDTRDGAGLVTSYAAAGATGWTALTPQHRDEFEGALVRSRRLVQVAVVALLLVAGAGLVVRAAPQARGRAGGGGLARRADRALQAAAAGSCWPSTSSSGPRGPATSASCCSSTSTASSRSTTSWATARARVRDPVRSRFAVAP